MAVPTVSVELAFGQSAANARDLITWTDVTARGRTVEPLTCNRGRAEAGEDASAGTLSVVLGNDDGALTPGRTSGEYGRVTTRIPIRVRANAGAGLRELWTGFVTDWAWTYEVATRVRAQAADFIATAGRTNLAPWLSGRVLHPPAIETENDVSGGFADTTVWSPADGGASETASFDTALDGGDAVVDMLPPPAVYWPLTDPAGATRAASGLDDGGAPADLVGPGPATCATFGQVSDVSPDTEATVLALVPESATAAKWLSGPVVLSGGRDVAVSMWVLPTANGRGMGLFALTGESTVPVSVRRGDDNTLVVREGDAEITFGTLPLAAWSHVYVQRDASVPVLTGGRYRVWVNGAARTAAGGEPIGWSPVAMPQRVRMLIGQVYGTPWEGQVAHVAVWPTIAGGEALAVHLANRGQWGPTAATRLRSLQYVTATPWATASWLTADSDAEARISAQPTAGKTLLEVAQQIATTEGGNLLATRGGRLRLMSSTATIATTPVLTLSAASDVLDVGEAFAIDDAELVASAQVTNQPSGQVFTSRRATADDTTGVEAATAETWAYDTVQAEAIAGMLAHRDTDAPRSPQLRVSMDRATKASLADDLLTLEIGDLIAVTDLPATAPATTMRLVVEAIEHSEVGQPGWTVTIDTSPGHAAAGCLLDDDDLSLLGVNAYLRV